MPFPVRSRGLFIKTTDFFRYNVASILLLMLSRNKDDKGESMPKMKSVKGAVKRFRVKKSGKVKRGTAFRSHILTKQDADTRRKQNAPKYLNKTDAKAVKEMIA